MSQKNNIKIYIIIYIKIALTCFGVTVTPSSGSALICAQINALPDKRCHCNTETCSTRSPFVTLLSRRAQYGT